MDNNIIAIMTNLGDSGQDAFAQNWSEYARLTLYEKGVSKKFIDSHDASFIIAKMVTDLIDDGNLSVTTNEMIATLRVNHPHSEDSVNV